MMLAVSIRISARSKPANIGTFDMGTALEYPDTDYKKPPERGGIVFEKTRMPPTECVRRLFRQPFRLSCMAASAAAAARPAAHIAQSVRGGLFLFGFLKHLFTYAKRDTRWCGAAARSKIPGHTASRG